MFGNYNQFGNYSMPTGTQPYGYPMNGYNMPQQPQMQTNTNKIYVSGIEDVRQRQLPNGSDVIFLDNDKPILYQKIVDSKGQFDVKAFSITPYAPQESVKNEQPMDLSAYAKQADIEAIKSEIKAIKDRLGA
jgi:hypothetical protein